MVAGGRRRHDLRFNRGLVRLALLAGTAMAVVGAAPAVAQDRQPVQAATRPASVPPGPLTEALNRIAAQTGLQILFDAQLANGRTTRGAQGSLTARQALSEVLSGTGLTARFTGSNAATVVETARAGGASPPGGAIELDPIDVQGQNPNAVLGNLPAPYAGGQVATGGQLGMLGNRDVMDTPFNQTSYTSKLIQDQQTKFIADVVQNDPSVTVDGGFGGPSGGADGFVIRGFAAANGDILFNGMPGVAPTWFNSMMSESIERVEVLKGPSALLNGAGALGSVGGAINLVSKKAGDEPLLQITPGYEMNSQLGGHVDLGRRFGPNKEFGVRFNGVYRKGDTAIDHQSRESRLATLGLDYRGERLRLSADLGYQYQNLKGPRLGFYVDSRIRVPRAPDTRTNASPPWGYVTPEVFYGVARGEFDILPNITAFAAIGGNQRKQPNIYVGQSISETAGSGTLEATSWEEQADAMDTLSTEFGVRGTFQTGPIKHEAAIAFAALDVDWRRVAGNSFSVPQSNIYNPVFGLPPRGPSPDPDNAKPLWDFTSSGTIIADTLSILDERVQLTAGVRFQEISSTSWNFRNGDKNSHYKGNAATPMIGLVVKPWSNVSLYGNYIEGLREGQIAPQDADNEGEVFPPYLTRQYEAGVKVDFGPITTTLAAYQITNPSAYVDPDTRIFGLNGDQRNRGIEFNVFGQLTDTIRLLGGATYIDAVMLNTLEPAHDGNRAAGVPKYRLVAGAEWDTPFLKRLTLTGRIIYNGSQFIDAANKQEIPGWTRVDVGARYTIERGNGKPIIIRANIENIFDTRAWIGSTYSGVITPNDPRTFKLSSTFEF